MVNKITKEKILIIDDVPANIKILGETLQDEYDIVFEMSGQKALAIAKTKSPALILLDIIMPEINGYEVCRQLKADRQTKDIPVIFITAMKEEEEETKGFEYGAVDYITKPFKPVVVKSRVRTHLDLKHHRDSLEEMVKERTLELEKAKDAAEAANIAKSEFLANTSHEFRTPLNAVIGFSDMMFDTHLNEDQIEYAKIVKQNGEMLLSLLNNVLDCSKVESGDLDLEMIDFDPELLSYDVCGSIRPKIEPKQIEILCRIGDTVPSKIKGDPLRLRQILTNLLGNALKFTESGEIRLSLNVEDEIDERVKFHITVQDTGIGIPEDKLSTIFAPFQQADGSTTRKYGGTGLGLSICKQLATLMDGDVWAESEVNKGSIFHFVGWFKKSEKMETRRFSHVSLAGRNVLVVDDNQTNLDILKNFIESTGMHAVTLKNEHDVLPVLEKAFEAERPFDVCLIDIGLPDISGYEVAKQIHNHDDRFSRLPLIALSSLENRNAKKCEKTGFVGFLSKPIRRKDLFQMLIGIINKCENESEKDQAVCKKIMTSYSVREEMKFSTAILVVEDHPVNQKLVTMMLSKAGYHVEVANNGHEAVEKYTAHPDAFDIILMDIQMPKMNGIEATRLIREKGFSEVPIVAVTAHAMTHDKNECLEAGMNDYITKPIKREIIFEVIDRWVFNKGSEKQSIIQNSA